MQIIFCKCGTAVADIENQLYLVYIVADFFNAPDELVSEYKRICIRKIKAIFDLVRGVSVIERHGKCA